MCKRIEPQKNTLWDHRRTKFRYEVLHIANVVDSARHPKMVVYKSRETMNVMADRFDEWHDHFVYAGMA